MRMPEKLDVRASCKRKWNIVLRREQRGEHDVPHDMSWDMCPLSENTFNCINFATKKLKGSPYSIAESRVPELIPVLCSQPAGDVSHKPGGRLPLLSARLAVTLATLKRAATNFAAWWTEARCVWTVCLRLIPNSVAAAIWTQALLCLSESHSSLGYRATLNPFYTCILLFNRGSIHRSIKFLPIPELCNILKTTRKWGRFDGDYRLNFVAISHQRRRHSLYADLRSHTRWVTVRWTSPPIVGCSPPRHLPLGPTLTYPWTLSLNLNNCNFNPKL